MRATLKPTKSCNDTERRLYIRCAMHGPISPSALQCHENNSEKIARQRKNRGATPEIREAIEYSVKWLSERVNRGHRGVTFFSYRSFVDLQGEACFRPPAETVALVLPLPESATSVFYRLK